MNEPSQQKRVPFPEKMVFIDANKDGIFEPFDTEEKPMPVQGQEQWMYDFYRSIKYPPSARNAGIGGRVILLATVDKNGKVTQVEVVQKVSNDCDQEAKRAFIESTLQGYHPFMVEGKPVNFQIEIPVGFNLH